MVRWLCLCVALVWSIPAPAQFFGGNQQQDWVAMWAFNNRTDDQVKKQLESGFKMRVSMIDRLCNLNETQSFKLDKAARADITRFFRDVTRIRGQVKEMGEINQNDNDDINKLWQLISPLSQKMQQGLFKKGSLFDKVVRSTLDEEQQSLFQAELKRNRDRRWKALTRLNVAEIETSMPMIDDQRQELIKLLDAQTLPEKNVNRSVEAYIGYLKLMKARKADDKLGGIFDKHQLAVINEYCDRYRGWENMLQ